MNQDIVALAYKYFKLQLPCTADELKLAYRQKAQLLHPDKGGSQDEFIRMKKAYDILIATPEVLSADSAQASSMTEEGVLLSELGLGHQDSAIICATCTGRGYTTVTEDKPFISCKTCRGTGAVVDCSKCKGTGKYVHPKTKRAIGKCNNCDGFGVLGVSVVRGLLTFQRYRVCSSCHGSGGYKSPKTLYRHYKCGDCDGKGQRPMFNPLIPKMRMGR